MDERKTPLRKAYELNHEGQVLGAFAEIGAGQEVARTFFHAGRSSSTIAKTMSAYAMEVSDDIYLSGEHGHFEHAEKISYTSRYRLMAMLHHEHKLMTDRFISRCRQSFREKRKSFPCVFSYADTFSTGDIHYGSRDTYNGWMGVRVQSRAGGGFSGTSEEVGHYVDLLAHVVLLEQDRKGQYETIGSMGVNMIQAACVMLKNPRMGFDEKELVKSLFDGVSKWKVRMDVLEINPSPKVRTTHKTFAPNNRELSLLVVQESLSHDTLLSTYNSKLPGELCSDKHAKNYPNWSPKFEEWHNDLMAGTGIETWAWMYPEDHVREPIRFLAHRDVCLIRGEIINPDPSGWRIRIAESVANSISKKTKEKILPIVVLPVHDLPKVPGNTEQIDFTSFDEAYLKWINDYPKSAVLITRSNDMAWIVESIRKSLGEDRVGRDREPFIMMLDRVHWLKELDFDFAACRNRIAVVINDHSHHISVELKQQLKRDWEQLSASALDCLQRIDRAGCTIEVVSPDDHTEPAPEPSDANLPQRGDDANEVTVESDIRADKAREYLAAYLTLLANDKKLLGNFK